MDKFDTDQYQFYTIGKDEINNLNDDDEILDLPPVLTPDDTDNDELNKPVFYLTFENSNNGAEAAAPSSSPPPQLFVDSSNAIDFNSTDVKLITLEDGRMFMTTDNSLDASSQLFIAPNDADSGFQLLQLADGSQLAVQMFKLGEEPEEPAKKAKRHACLYEGCGKVYGSSYHLTVHLRTHTDSKPYGCTADGCAKRFTTNYSRKAHMRTHTGEKPYGCSLCAKQFKTSGDLQKHVRIHTGEKPFGCPVAGCGKAFTTSNIRKVHVRSHTGERPYACHHPDCGKSFSSATNYKNHLRIHSGEKPYVCAVEGCGKRFTEYSSLYKHNSVHQPVRLHICVFCGQGYKQESALNFHKRLKHNVMVAKDGTEIMVKID